MDYLSTSDAFVVVEELRNGKFVEIHRTEAIMDNLNPQFAKPFFMMYKFEEVQHLRFTCYDTDDGMTDTTNFDMKKQNYIGFTEVALSKILCTPKKRYLAELVNESNTKKKWGTLIVNRDYKIDIC